MSKTKEELQLACMNVCFGEMPGETSYDWVMFTHGTYFAFHRLPLHEDIEKKAKDLMERWGEVHVGTYRADFNPISMVQDFPDDFVWMVTFECHEPNTRFGTVVVWEEKEERYRMGMAGRMYREKDSENPVIIATNRSHPKKNIS